MGICRPFHTDPFEKYPPPAAVATFCAAECPYALDLPPPKLPPPPLRVAKDTVSPCSKDPLISYQTSTGRALVYKLNPSTAVNFDREPLPRDLMKRDPELLADTYKSTYGTSYVNRYSLGTCRLNSKPPRTGPGMSVKIYSDRVKAHPPRPITNFNSTMQDSYRPHQIGFKNSIVVPTIQEISSCRLNRVGFEAEDAFPVHDGGYVRELDVMLPTTAKDFRRFEKQEVEADAPASFYTEQGLWVVRGGIASTVGGCRPTAKNYEKGMLRSKLVPITYLHYAPPSVPHKGDRSEMKAKYRHHIDKLFIRSSTPLVKCPLSLTPYDATEVLSCPGMYVPESAHYGSRIPVRTLVDIGYAGPDDLWAKLDFCTHQKTSCS